MKIHASFILLFCISLSFFGCGKSKNTPFDHPVDQPLIDSNVQSTPSSTGGAAILSTDYCKPDTNGPYGDTVKYSDAINITHGHSDQGGTNNKGFDWGQGGACVNRPIREAWAVLHNIPLFRWGGTDSSTFSLLPSPPGIAYFYEVNYHINTVIGGVDFQMDWYHSIHGGTENAPTKIVINYAKVNGTSHISYWEGSIILDYISPTVTAISAVDHVNADRTDDNDAAGSVDDIITKTRTGAPDWDAIGGQNPVVNNNGGTAGTGSVTPAKTAECFPDASGTYSDAIVVKNGRDQNAAFDWSEGGACVKRSIEETWAALSNQDAMAWDDVKLINFTKKTPAENAANLFEVSYHIEHWFSPNTDWTMDWSQAVTAGTHSAPQTVEISYKKAFGSDHISYWNGKATLQSLGPKLTAIHVRDEMSSEDSDAKKPADHLNSLINKARSLEPNWQAVD